ncbi:hypothetical protein LIDJA_17195 [Leptospira interrogans]
MNSRTHKDNIYTELVSKLKLWDLLQKANKLVLNIIF